MPRFLKLVSGEFRSAFEDKSVSSRALRSTFFSVFGFLVENGLRLAGNLVLTRLLFPEAFGLMALVTVVLTGLAMVSDFGLKGAVVQNRHGSDPGFLRTVWTLQAIRGVLLAAVTFLASTHIGAFYAEPLLGDMLKVASVIPLALGFASTGILTSNKELTLGRQTSLAITTQLIGLLITIILAYWLRTVWALVIGSVIAPIVYSVASHLVWHENRDRIGWNSQFARQIFNFGFFIFLATVAGFAVQQGDRAILGKFVSMADLAIYTIAFFLASVPSLLNGKIIEAVVFPLYVKKPPREDVGNKEKIEVARRVLSASMLVLAFLIALVGDWLVHSLYDARYILAGPILVIIAIAQMPTIVYSSYDTLALAAGESKRFALIVAVSAIIKTTCTFLGAHYFGLVGVAISPLVSSVIHYPILITLTVRYRSWDPKNDFFGAIFILVLGTVALYNNSETLALLRDSLY